MSNNVYIKIVIGIVSFCLAVIYVLKCIDLNFIQDDAYTAFRYIKNLFNGSGLVFNQGEYVEGYTNFLWILILSIPYLSGITVENASQFLSVAFGVFSLIPIYLIGDRLTFLMKTESFTINPFARLINLLPVFLMIMSGAFSYWGISGMETTLFTFLVLSGFYFYLRRSENKINYFFVSFFILAAVTRPEGSFFYFIIIIHGMILRFYKSGETSIISKLKAAINRKFIFELLLFCVPLIAHVVFRIIYYGYPLPNTFYAKVAISSYHFIRGIRYIQNFTESYLLYGLVAVLPLWMLSVKKIRWTVSLFYSVIIIYTIYILLIGGDVLPINRFFLPVLPLIYILLVVSIFTWINKVIKSKILNGMFNLGSVILIISFGIFIQQKEHPRINEMLAYEKGLVQKMKIYAEWINDRQDEVNKEYSVALSTIGAFSYYSDATVIDLIGLTDEHIAHNPEIVIGIPDDFTESWKERRQNSAYILKREPDYVIFPAGAKPSAFAESVLFSNREFNYFYYPQLIYSEKLNQMIPIFTRKNEEQLAETNSDILNSVCDISFIKHFVNANNMFLKYLNSRDPLLLKRIEDECNEVSKKCPVRKSEALTLLGYTYYHSGDRVSAKSFFQEALKLDNFNSSAHLYLKTIYFDEGNSDAALTEMSSLKKLSPYAIPDPLRKSY